MAINMHMEGVDVGDNDNGVAHAANQSERPQNSDNNAGPSRSTAKTSKTDSDTEGKWYHKLKWGEVKIEAFADTIFTLMSFKIPVYVLKWAFLFKT